MNEREAKEKVVDAGIRLVESGLIARTWGNVSCRISDSHFVISPSGRDYMSLTSGDIVTVAIADLSYTGDIKPSSEKGVHAEIYKHSSGTNFIMHTHQENASVISTLGLGFIPADSAYPLLCGEIICASYGLPGTKTLRRNIADALVRSKGHAIIMKNHGAVCFGKDESETFQIASDLEQASIQFAERKYMETAGEKSFDTDKMQKFALSKLARKWKGESYGFDLPYCNSERNANGFTLHIKDNAAVEVTLDHLERLLPKEAEIHNEIYHNNKNINCIIHADSPEILTVSRANITLYPLVDDFAQIIGTKVKTVIKNPAEIADALKNTSAVLIGNHGALCCGASEGDASAVQMIMEKNCKARIFGTLFGDVKPLSRLDCKLMRVVYQTKYSKQISSNKKQK